MDNKEMSSAITEIRGDVKEIKDHVHTIDITMAENTASLKEHMAQTQLLKEMVLPLHTERIERIAIEDYKTKQKQNREHRRNELYDKLKIPGFIISAIAAAATVLKMLGKL